MKDITGYISPLIESQFPSFYREEGTLFIAFVKSYYEWLEQYKNTIYQSRKLLEYRDIDQTTDDFLVYFKEESLKNIQFDTATNKRLFLKNALDFYRSKGSERSIDLFFKLVYAQSASVRYPGDDIFKLSDNTWKIPIYIEVNEVSTNSLYEGRQITGTVSGATAFVESYSIKKKINNQFDLNGNLVNISKNIHVFFLSNLVGSFKYGEKVLYVGLIDPRDAPTIIGSLNELEVLTGASDYIVGDIVNITSNTGMHGKAVVTSIYNTTGQVDFSLIDGGWGFTSAPKIIISEKTLRVSDVSCSGGIGTGQYPFNLFETVNQKLANITFTAMSSGNQFNANDYISTYNGDGSVNGYGKILSISYNNPTTSGEIYITIANGDFSTIASSIYNSGNVTSATRGTYSDKSAFANLTSLTTNNSLILNDIIGLPIRKGEIIFQGNSTIETATAYVETSTIAGTQLLVTVSNTVGVFVRNARVFGKSTSSNSNLLSYSTYVGIADTSTTTIASINVATISVGVYANGQNYANGTVLNYIATSGSGAIARIGTTALGNISSITLKRGGSGYILPPSAYIANSAVASSFNASTDVSDVENFITIASNPFINAQYVQYKVSSGNTALSGLTNNTNYYVRVSNTTGITLSLAPKGAVIDIAPGLLEDGHSFTPVVSDGSGAFFEVKLGNPFEFGYNTFITAKDSNTACEITQIGTGSLASFNVTSLDDEETVELFTDFISSNNIYGADYLDIRIDGTDLSSLSGTVAYGFPANPGGSFSSETIGSMLALDEYTIGTISLINKTNPGEDYNLDPLVTIIEPMMYGYRKSDYILTITGSTSSFLRDENLLFISRQAFNGGTDVASDFITLGESLYGNGSYIQYVVSSGTTVVGGLANNAYYYVVGVDLVSFPNKIKLATTLSGTAISLTPSSGSNHFIQNGSYSKLGKIKTIIDNNRLNVTRLSLLADIKENVVTWAKGETSGFISAVTAEKTNTFSGLNSIIEANVVTSNGAVGTLSVINSGFGTERFDICSFARENDPTATIGVAKALVERQGTGEGFSQYTRGFLSSDKYIHDGDFYQDYSYELVSRIPYERYSEMLKKVLHVAGTKMFPAVELESVVEVPIGVSLNIETAPYTPVDFDFINYYESAPTTTFTRASIGTYFDSIGVLQTAPIDTPRYDYEPSTLASRGLMLEEARTNSIRNNTMVGAAPGTPPTNWSIPSVGGITATVVSTGTENGINYIDINLSGTAIGSPTYFAMFLENPVAALPSSIWTNSFYMKLISGVLPGGAFQIMNVLGNYNSVSTLIGQYLTVNVIPTSAALNTQRSIATSSSTTFDNATTVSIRPWIQFNIPLSTVMDITVRIGMPQLELGGYASSVIPTSNAIVTRAVESNLVDYDYLDSRISLSRASSATYFDKFGILQTASNNKPRYDYNPSTLTKRGLLIEEARTNSIRNNTMKGVVVGIPGTGPKNWAIAVNGSGLSTQIVGTGVESGINYIDVRFYGTTSLATDFVVYPEPVVTVVASNGQTWASSFFVRMVAGSTTNINVVRVVTRGVTNLNATTTVVAGTDFKASLGVSSIASNRQTAVVTMADPTTAAAQTNLSCTHGSGVAIDITLRIGLPQLELGAFATSVILTSSVAVTRIAENYTVDNLTSFYQSNVGTLFTESLLTRQCALGATGIARFKDTPYTNAVSIFYRPNGFGGVNIMPSSISVFDQSSPSSAIAANVILKLALAYSINDFAASGNGNAPTLGSSGTVPTGINSMVIGNQTNYLNGYIRRITYYPVRLTNAELQTITT